MVSQITYNTDRLQNVCDYLNKWGHDIKRTQIHNSILTGKVITLNDHIWQRLENTDSKGFKKGEYNKLPKTLKWRRLFMRMLFGKAQKKPIIISYDVNKYYLLEGDKKLVISKILGKRPKVIFATL